MATIKEGDLVLAYNSNLGIYDYKDVVEVYKNKAKELCHIYTEKEEIVCTPNHNILTKTGWKEAKDITLNDYIKTTTDFEKVNKIEIEELENEVDVYNLNVLCYHTYVIGNSLFIVHNACIKDGATHRAVYDYNGKRTNAFNKGGGKIYYAFDRAGHGGSFYKGFELSKNKKLLRWIGDFDENFVKIIGKHKGNDTMIFNVIKIVKI